MALLDYTFPETIRAVVGVAETELPDDILRQLNFELEVVERLGELSPTLPALHASIRDMTAPTRTAQQARLLQLVHVYSAFVVAKVLLGGSIALFAPKTIEDGKAVQERVQDPFSALRTDVEASLALWAARILRTLALIDPLLAVNPALPRTHIAGIPILADPVTGA